MACADSRTDERSSEQLALHALLFWAWLVPCWGNIPLCHPSLSFLSPTLPTRQSLLESQKNSDGMPNMLTSLPPTSQLKSDDTGPGMTDSGRSLLALLSASFLSWLVKMLSKEQINTSIRLSWKPKWTFPTGSNSAHPRSGRRRQIPNRPRLRSQWAHRIHGTSSWWLGEDLAQPTALHHVKRICQMVLVN